MSDPIETTAAGATRTFFGALAFILLMVGVEGMTGVAPLSFFSSLVLLLFGGLFFYAAVFWETAKKHLSPETQIVISRFAQSRVTRFGMLFLVLQTLILAPFIEQHRWPFSFPTDPTLYDENRNLKNEIGGLQVNLANAMPDATKWRFAYNLRFGARAANGNPLACKFFLVLSPSQPARNTWADLQRILDLARWENVETASPFDEFQGITLLTGPTTSDAPVKCVTAFGNAFGAAYPNHQLVFHADQVTPNLVSCKNECVEMRIGN